MQTTYSVDVQLTILEMMNLSIIELYVIEHISYYKFVDVHDTFARADWLND